MKDLVFIGGHTPRAPDGSVVGEGDFAAQFAQVYANLTTTIENAGIEWTDVVSLRTYLARPDDVLSFRVLRDAEHARLFPDGGAPVHTLLIVGLAEPELLIEIDAVAVVR